jgi:hypothetical protein
MYRRNPNSVSSKNIDFQRENAVQKAKDNLKSILNYNIDDTILRAIILKTKINWTPKILNTAVKELENIKLDYFEKYNKSISKKDKKIITEWTYLRLLKIISTVIIKGNFASKIKAFQVLLLNSKMFLSNKVMQNIFNRFVWLFNRIRYNN